MSSLGVKVLGSGVGFKMQGLGGCSARGSRFMGSGFRVRGSGPRVWVVGFKVQGSGSVAWDSRCMIQGAGFRVQG
eukprot:CAMPEP_0198691602 /NCGR_PEP_ID=MMETSP1468-20131203/207767_1 /TAXON_ID=1461545 /ORGANISM="Mantoniella sp, Strain CCMP1436" /LENGTH=74 /DNA_ID=CAMNT_0044444921 /DNA_START=15 /DNA_END=236 /DNA_ORIENTATION=-